MQILRTILTILFVIDCIALTVVVLMQEGKSQGLGAIAGHHYCWYVYDWFNRSHAQWNPGIV